MMAELFVACCDCPEPTILNYTNCDLSVTSLDNSGEKPQIALSDTILKSAYGIRVNIERKEGHCEIADRHPSFFQLANAISCDCPPELQYLPLDSLMAVKVFSVNEFDESHWKNSDVSNFFYVYGSYEFTPIPEFINHLPATLYDWTNTNFEFDILLMTPPEFGSEHQFIIVVELSDSRELEAQTNLIKFIE